MDTHDEFTQPAVSDNRSVNSNVEKMAEKIRNLEAMLNDTVRRTDTLEEVDINKLFPREDPEEIRSYTQTDTSSDDLSVNTAKDKPFLTGIGGHTFKENGAILFRCHDTDDDNESWCLADKAITNVGKKLFKKYVEDNKLKKTSYTPATVKPISKKNLKKLANISQSKANNSKNIIKIIETRRTNDGDKYKVICQDLTTTWKTNNQIGPNFMQLINEFEKVNGQDKQTKDKNTQKTKAHTKKKSPKKSVKSKKNSTPKSTKKRTDGTPMKNKSPKKI